MVVGNAGNDVITCGSGIDLADGGLETDLPPSTVRAGSMFRKPNSAGPGNARGAEPYLNFPKGQK